MTPFELQLRRDLSLGWAGRGDMLVVLGFFLIIITLFPLALGPDPVQLRIISVPVIWVAAMLASLAGFTRIFADDVRCGWVDQVALSPMPLPVYALAKAVGHWVLSALPIIVATPLMALLLNLGPGQLVPMMLALVLGTLALTLLGVIGAALTEGARGGGGLMALLVLPPAMPVLIFGALASTPEDGRVITPHLMLLGAVLAVLLAIAPFITAAALAESESESGG
ncbi:MAG: heme exporter protein CcmB [Candidatus Puniceispirillum sp. TMED245]|nr:MAG: heme exporter protein CcmB [Candidatus Puniceispirillum sp. TMED245]